MEITTLLQPLPGVRLVAGKEEDGSAIAFRKGGDEILFASWDDEPPRGLEWIPVNEFSPDPEAVQPPGLETSVDEQPGAEDAPPTERPSRSGPFGRGIKRREVREG